MQCAQLELLSLQRVEPPGSTANQEPGHPLSTRRSTSQLPGDPKKKKEKRPQRPHGAGGPPKTPIIAAAAARQAPRRLQEGCNFHPADPPQSRIRLLASPNDTSHGPPVHPPSLVVSHRAAPLAPSGDSLFPRANRDPHPFPPDVWLRCDPPSR